MKNTKNPALKKGKLSTFYNLIKTNMDIKKWISGLTAFTLALGVSLNIQVQETKAFTGSGSGTVGDPYIITTCNQLQEMELDLAAYYELGNDIDCSATSTWNSGAGFAPVGNYNATYFSGNFNGNGYVISDLYVNKSTLGGAGLFGAINNAIIQNVALENANVSGINTETGILIGHAYNTNTISNSYTTGTVGAGTRGGGFIGNAYNPSGNTTITNCYSSADVTATSTTGGFLGLVNSTGIILQNVYATGNINGTGGRLVGGVYSGSPTVTNSYYYSGSTCTSCTDTYGTAEATLSNFYDKTYDVYDTNSPVWDFTTPVWYENAGTFPSLKLLHDTLTVINNEQDWSGEADTDILLPGGSGEVNLESGAETLTFNSTQTMNMGNGVIAGTGSETHNSIPVTTALGTLKGSSVSAAKKTLLQSGTNGVDITLQTTGTTAASVLIPDDTTVYSEDTWDGVFSPPIDTSGSIVIPQKNVYSGVKVGSDTVSFVMDKPARVSLGSTTGDPMYKDGAGTWNAISACSDATVNSAGSLAFPNECYIEDSGTTYIWTYHFTEFGDAGDPTDTAVSLEVTPGSVTISAPTTIDFGTLSTSTSSTVQTVDLESGSDYFSIEDLASEDTGYYITLSAGDLTDGANTISSTNFTINLEGRSVTTFSTDPSGAPVIPSALLDPGSGDNAINGLTILERTSSVNGVIGEYGIQPLFKLTVPAYTALGSYTGTFTMTLM